MADCADPKLFEIAGSLLWQDSLVDLVIARFLLAAFKETPNNGGVGDGLGAAA